MYYEIMKICNDSSNKEISYNQLNWTNKVHISILKFDRYMYLADSNSCISNMKYGKKKKEVIFKLSRILVFKN